MLGTARGYKSSICLQTYLILHKDKDRSPHRDVLGAILDQQLCNEAVVLALPVHGGLHIPHRSRLPLSRIGADCHKGAIPGKCSCVKEQPCCERGDRLGNHVESSKDCLGEAPKRPHDLQVQAIETDLVGGI